MALSNMMIPDLGGAENVEVIEICVAVGDVVSEGDSIIVVETDKASMEIPASNAGTIKNIVLKEGDTCSQGDVMVEVEAADVLGEASVVPDAVLTPEVEAQAEIKAEVEEVDGDMSNVVVEPVVQAKQAVAANPAPVQVQAQAQAQASVVPDVVAVIANSAAHAGPAVRMLARELGVDLAQVVSTGPRDRVLKEDIQSFVKQKLQQPVAPSMQGQGIAQPPEIDFSQFGATDRVKMSKIKRITAQNMTRSWLNVPHVTQFDHADITELEVFRKGLKAEAEQRGTKVTPLPFMLKVCAMALLEYPQFNVALDNDGEHIVEKHYVNIGVAVDTPSGLMVPVIRDVDKKSIWQLSEEVIAMGAKAKAKKLLPADMQGGCFTISSLGSIGGTAFTPIVNTPEVAILGVSKAEMQPRWNGAEFEPRLMVPLSLSYDHRAVNGADAARFTQYLGKLLGDIRHLVM